MGALTEPDEGFFTKTLRNMRSIWHDMARDSTAAPKGPDLSSGDISALKKQFSDCLVGAGGDVSARARAAQLGECYLGLNDDGRLKFLTLIANDFGVDRLAVGEAVSAYQVAKDDDSKTRAEGALRKALYPLRLDLLTQFNAIPQGVKFLVDMRADLLRYKAKDAALNLLDQDMQGLLTGWFDIGFLELQQITWDSPASLLEKLIQYESVHEITSWDDLRNRLDSDRRLYAFFHPRMPTEPLIFVEVALVNGISSSVQTLLDENAPILNPRDTDTAIFYSISNTQVGLRGISFGNFLIKRVVASLTRDLPNLKSFSTLSPLPGFMKWFQEAIADGAADLFTVDARKAIKAATGKPFRKGSCAKLFADNSWQQDAVLVAALKEPFLRLAARYLANEKRGRGPLDPVARFHLGNGAQIEQLNWQGDTSDNGLNQSAGLMVNYLYKLNDIEKNHERFARDGHIAMSSTVEKLI